MKDILEMYLTNSQDVIMESFDELPVHDQLVIIESVKATIIDSEKYHGPKTNRLKLFFSWLQKNKMLSKVGMKKFSDIEMNDKNQRITLNDIDLTETGASVVNKNYDIWISKIKGKDIISETDLKFWDNV